MVTEGSGGSVFGLPIYAASYSSTIFPAVLSVWVMSYVEHFISRHSPKSLRVILQPTLTILIMTPLSLCFLSPIGAMLSSGFCSALMAFYSLCGPIAVAVFCAIVPFVVMFGMHVGTVPFCVQAIASTGIEQIILPAFSFQTSRRALPVWLSASRPKRAIYVPWLSPVHFLTLFPVSANPECTASR